MAMNKIQFQPGLSMRDFQRQYGTDEQCEAALFAARWPYESSTTMKKSTRKEGYIKHARDTAPSC